MLTQFDIVRAFLSFFFDEKIDKLFRFFFSVFTGTGYITKQIGKD